jgi:hypothetical protein
MAAALDMTVPGFVRREVFLASETAVAAFISLNRSDDFPLGMSFCQIAESFRRFTQRIASIDDWRYHSGFQKVLQK